LGLAVLRHTQTTRRCSDKAQRPAYGASDRQPFFGALVVDRALDGKQRVDAARRVTMQAMESVTRNSSNS
jgi:hypothetical protein